MRDRFPLLFLGGLLLLGALGAFLLHGARRGAFAERGSTFRSEPDGARALYLLLQEAGAPVERAQVDFERLTPGRALALLGVRFAGELGPGAADADAGVDLTGPRSLAATLGESFEITGHETDALLAHVRAGATVLYAPATADTGPLLSALGVTQRPADASLGLRTLVPAQPSRWVQGVERVEARVQAFLELPPGAVPLLLDAHLEQVAAAVVPLGEGRVVVLGAPALAENQTLALADNARLWHALAATAAREGPLSFDEYHHGFTNQRSVGEFAARAGLHLAAAQLLLGVMAWALSLRRFGRPRLPAEAQRLGSADALAATARLYREGRHVGHAAAVIARQLAAELAPLAGVGGHAEGSALEEALAQRGRGELAHALRDVAGAATTAKTEADLQRVARLAALARSRLHAPHPRTTS